MKKTKVPANPGRLIGAVANIGYDHEVALCDLVDNCIDAKASKVEIALDKESHEAEGRSDSIGAYVISDDGTGMDESTLVDAFTLGTQKDYPPGSLGKFGLGLKSAGLALGREIILLTSTGGSPLCARLSIAEVEMTGKYEIDLGDVPDELTHYWDRYGSTPGTVLLLRDLHSNQPAYSAFNDYLARFCSTTYHRFMDEDQEKPLVMSLNGKELSPFDPLFLAQAKENNSLGDPKQWDGKSVRMLMEGELELPGAENATITATHLVHPPSFGAQQHDIGQEYAIVADPYTRRPRHGFYVYRNNRVIVLAERFHGIVGSTVQNYAFRARLMFNEEADALLSLDVKKRHCQLPPAVRSNLKASISVYQGKSVTAWRAAGERVEEEKRERKDDIANQSMANSPPTSLDDYAPGADPQDEEATSERKRKQADISRETVEAIHDEELSKEELDTRARKGDVVIKTRGIKGNAMWLPYPAVAVGKAETLVNEQHSWVSEAYLAAEDEPRITVVLHQLFTILARAELDVRSRTWSDMPDEHVKKIFDRFRRIASAIGEDFAEQLEAALTGDSMETDN